MNEVNKKTNAEKEWKRTLESLRAAELLLKEGLSEESLSRSYYAVFHAVKTLLLTKGLQARTHSGVGQLFNLHFVKDNVFPARFGQLLSYSHTDRLNADYDADYIFSEDSAEKRIGEVKEFLAATEAFLKKEGYLS